MASAPFDSFGQNGAHGIFLRVNLAKLAVKCGLKGGTLKQLLIAYGHGITRPGVLYKNPWSTFILVQRGTAATAVSKPYSI